MMDVIARKFFAGAGYVKKIDKEEFNLFKKQLNPMLAIPEVDAIIIVSNGGGSPQSEIIIDGETPTTLAVREAYPEDVASGKIILHICKDWGENPGSGQALNEGLNIVAERKTKHVMMWSSEMEVSQEMIKDALITAEERELAVIGFLREGWEKGIQYQLPQNTANIWLVEQLLKFRFADRCNGGLGTVHIDGFGSVSIAGMEDYEAMLRMMSVDKLSWGMIGVKNPLKWDTNFKKNSERELRHREKVARQARVMEEYAKLVFPNRTFDEVMDEFTSKRKILI